MPRERATTGAKAWGRLALVCAIVALSAPLAAQSVAREQLANGMTLVVDTRSDTHAVALRLEVAAGPLFERELLGTGVSALIAATVAEAARDGRLAEAATVTGGELTVDRDVSSTAYALTTTDRHVGDGLAVLAAALAYRENDDAVLVRQRDLQLADARAATTDAQRYQEQRLEATVFRQHPLRVPAPGVPHLVEGLTPAAIRAYHERRYAAPRCILVVAGNVDPAQVRAQVRARFDGLPAGGWAPDWRPGEPPQYEERVARFEGPVVQERHAFAWRTVAQEHRDQAVLALVAELLEMPGRSPLHRALVGGQLATDLEVTNRSGPDRPGTFELAFTPFPGRGAEAWEVVQRELDNLARHGPEVALLAEAKRLLRRRYLDEQGSVADAAAELARWERAIAVPGYGAVVQSLIDGCDTEQIRRVVGSLLDPSGRNRSKLILVPRGSGNSPAADEPGPTLADVPPKLLDDLGQGVRGLLRRMPHGLVHLRATMGGGSAADSPGHAGASAVLAAVLAEGHQGLHGSAFRDFLAEHGMQLTVGVDHHTLEIGLTCFPADVERGLEVLLDIVKRPALPDDAVARAIQDLQAARAFEGRDPDWRNLLDRALRRQLLGDHYAAIGPTGTRETVAAIDRSILLDHHARMAVGERLVLSVYGEFDGEVVAGRMRDLLAADPVLPRGEPWRPQGEAWAGPPRPSLGTVTWERPDRGALTLAWRGPALEQWPEQAPVLHVIDALARGASGGGGAVTGTLSSAGLPVASFRIDHEVYAGRGLWLMGAAVGQGRVEPVAEAMRQAVAGLVERLTLPADDPAAIDDAALERARQRCTAERVLATEDQVAAQRLHARSLLLQGAVEPALAYRKRVEAVTRDQLRLAAATWLDVQPAELRLVPAAQVPAPVPEPQPDRAGQPAGGAEAGTGAGTGVEQTTSGANAGQGATE